MQNQTAKTLTTLQAVRAYQALVTLRGTETCLWFFAIKNEQALRKIYENYLEAERAIVDKYVQRDENEQPVYENGGPVYQPGKDAEALALLKAEQETEHTVQIYPLQVTDQLQQERHRPEIMHAIIEALA